MKTTEQFLKDNEGKEVFAEDLSTEMLIYLLGSDKRMVPNYVKYKITICFHKPKITA